MENNGKNGQIRDPRSATLSWIELAPSGLTRRFGRATLKCAPTIHSLHEQTFPCQSPWSERFLQSISAIGHRVIFQRSRKCLEKCRKSSRAGQLRQKEPQITSFKSASTWQNSFVKLSWGSGHWQNGCQVDTKKGVVALTP